ncbi:hypothetical protein N7492_004159 [Penicillium capsulatum]|uniref:S-adenosyl-L-methionine-dependent methyltransferase n=1 Tax=Penicillium capsulatum TaxID=69766 RepID=A0A9W9IN78_9EURO|nr:hypothetical protein N7492_004159 [Penicillium capsulatum]
MCAPGRSLGDGKSASIQEACRFGEVSKADLPHDVVGRGGREVRESPATAPQSFNVRQSALRGKPRRGPGGPLLSPLGAPKCQKAPRGHASAGPKIGLISTQASVGQTRRKSGGSFGTDPHHPGLLVRHWIPAARAGGGGDGPNADLAWPLGTFRPEWIHHSHQEIPKHLQDFAGPASTSAAPCTLGEISSPTGTNISGPVVREEETRDSCSRPPVPASLAPLGIDESDRRLDKDVGMFDCSFNSFLDFLAVPIRLALGPYAGFLSIMADSHRPPGPSEIEVDADVSSSSDYDSIRTETTSLTESVYSYVYENGRTYQAYRPETYLLPNDEKEQDRLDMLHHVFCLAQNGELCRTPLEHPQKILDIGTGTGIWAIDMADEFPSAEVTGVDLSPIQPGWVPPNLRFVIDDVNQDWSFPTNSYDFIHVRSLAGSVEHWPTFLRRCYEHLKPGGRLEVSECRPHAQCDDDTYPEDCHLRAWEREFHRITQMQGQVWDISPDMPRMVKDAMFENVDYSERFVPIGTWPKDPKLKEIGRFFRAEMADGAVESYSLAVFTRFGGWTTLEVQVLLAHLRAELRSNKMHVYTTFAFTTARKPLY